jgi:GT2 family glycosyltransferase
MSDKPPQGANELAELEFNEIAYLTAFPQVVQALQKGRFKSAHEHYLQLGVTQNRLRNPAYHRAYEAQRLLRPEPARTAPATVSGTLAEPQPIVPYGLDALIVSPGSYALVIGWADDRRAKLVRLCLTDAEGQVFVTSALPRCRRADAEVAVGGVTSMCLFGFWALIPIHGAGSIVSVTLCCGAHELTATPTPRLADDVALRDSVFEYLANAIYFGNPAIDSAIALDSGAGDALVCFNALVSSRFCNLAFVEQFGPQRAAYRGSVIVCLYGRPEYLFIQQALFSASAGARDYEFIYVCNSPELSETLLREARIAAGIYQQSITLVLLPGNAGFGAANNAAAKVARSKRLLITNPDVFPHSGDWAALHDAIIAGHPAAQTKIFGAPLFYDDGSLMHAGMYFAVDRGVSVKPDGITARELLRVEHYAKGAAPNTAAYRGSRPVPAITGAFISADRDSYEKLGGFSEEYVFGHYEDADLCLKAWKAGMQVWVHDLPLWHLEGKGSVRKRPHEGGSLINRWYFTRTWHNYVANHMLGRAPTIIATVMPEVAS